MANETSKSVIVLGESEDSLLRKLFRYLLLPLSTLHAVSFSCYQFTDPGDGPMKKSLSSSSPDYIFAASNRMSVHLGSLAMLPCPGAVEETVKCTALGEFS